MKLFGRSDRKKQAAFVADALAESDERILEMTEASGMVFPDEAATGLMTRPDEEVLVERPATLLKDVVQREFRGGSRGISIPLGHGVRYRTSAFKGHSVVTGTSLEAADSGTLSLTSHRIVFSGSRKTIEAPLSKLISVDVYEDGLGLHISGRESVPLLRVRSAALITNIASGVISGEYKIMSERVMRADTREKVLSFFRSDPKPRTVEEMLREDRGGGESPMFDDPRVAEAAAEVTALAREGFHRAAESLVDEGILMRTGNSYAPVRNDRGGD